MRPLTLQRALGALAISLCLAATARADDPPAPSDRHPGRDSTLPTLDQTFGLDATSSQPTQGFGGLSQKQLGDYVKSVQAINVAVAFHTDKGHSTDVGDTSHWKVHHLGPIPIPTPRLNTGVELRGDQDVKVSASYSKKKGDGTATLDEIKLEAPAAHFGPFGWLSLQKAEIKSNGEIDLKLAKYLPTIRVTQITHDGNGDVHLHVKWAPDVYITKDGKVQIHIGPSFAHFTKTIGHVDVNFFEEWPPSLQDFLGLAAAPAAAKTGGIVQALDPDVKRIVDSLRGKATFDLHAETKDTPVDWKGTKADASLLVDVHGDGRIENGRFTTIGDKNTANVKLSIGDAEVNTSKGGAKIDHAEFELAGRYQLDVPMDDPNRHMIVDFDGRAKVSGAGKDAHLQLPNGATVRVANYDGSADVGLKIHSDASGRTFQLDDGHYSLGASGPIHVKKLGAISSLDADGQLRSKGTIKIGKDGLAQLTGDLRGKAELGSDLPLDLNGTKTTVKKGTDLDVDFARLDAALSIPGVAGKPGKPSLLGVDAEGDLGVHGAVGSTSFSKNGTTVHASGAGVDATFHGGIHEKGGALTASGHVVGGATLQGPATVSAPGLHTTLGTGSSISLQGDVAKNDKGLTADGTVKAHAPLGATSYSKNGTTVNAPSGTLDLTANGKIGPNGTNAHFDAELGVGGGTKVNVANGPHGSHFGTTLQAGTHFGVMGDIAGNMIKGTLKGQANAHGIDAGIGPIGPIAGLGPTSVHIPADAKIGVTAPFVAQNGKVQSGSATVPIRVDLHKGTTITIDYKGVTGSIVLDTEGTYVDLVAKADIVNGKPVIRSLDDCDINIVLGDVAAKALGQQVGVPVAKRLTFKGDASFRSSGLDLKGALSLGNKGAQTSFFQINW